MISQIEIELTNLRNSLIELCNMVVLQIDKAGNALNNADLELADEVIRYEKRVNGLEVNVEKACENILALYNPVAHDLRFVLSTLKINLNLERIGDYARSIAKIVKTRQTAYNKDIIKMLEINKMFETGHLMLLTVLEAMETEDDKALRHLFIKDEILNDIQDNAIQLLVDYIGKNPKDIEECLNLYIVIRKMERVGDHIKNIAEEIIFYKEAKILRHKSKKIKRGLREE